jgi:hypothetical protein
MQTSARELIDRGPSLSVGMLTADLLRRGEELGALDEAGVELGCCRAWVAGAWSAG